VKNFPHQYNDLHKLRATLETARDLDSQGLDSTDNAILGYELARRRVYGFRPALDYSGDDAAVSQLIAERLEVEQGKSASSQGTRTAAREMRRTLRYLGWLEEGGTALTPAGDALLATAAGSDEERTLMQQAIASIPVADQEGRVSHPVQILLRLVDEVALDSREGMELALEAVDDSVAEFDRIVQIAAMPSASRIDALKTLGWTTSQIANSVKIIPSFADQSGLITTDGTGRYILTEAGQRAINRPAITTQAPRTATVVTSRRRAAVSATTRNASEVGLSRRTPTENRRALTPEEQSIAAELLYERTERHQAVVRAVAAHSRTGKFYEDSASYDLLIDLDSSDPLVLIEVKTISGDSAAQIRAALGQLLYYEHFSVTPTFPGREIRRLVVTDARIDDELADFLQNHNVAALAYIDNEFVSMNDLGEQLGNHLF
jgi:hypothetical protein